MHPTSNFLDVLGIGPDHTERIKYRSSVIKLLIDDLLVAVERIEGDDPDPALDVFTPILKPVAVDHPQPAQDQVKQSSPTIGLFSPPWGELDYSGQLLGITTTVLDQPHLAAAAAARNRTIRQAVHQHPQGPDSNRQ